MIASVRLHQALGLVRKRETAVNMPAQLSRLLTPEARVAFDTLHSVDRRHLIRVATEVAMQKPTDNDVIAAALLHDIGKGSGSRPVRFPDRVAKVLLAAIAPSLLDQIGKRESPWPGAEGLWVLGRHAQRGAKLVRMWGYSDRVALLVEHHECANPADSDLALIISIDNQSPGTASGQ